MTSAYWKKWLEPVHVKIVLPVVVTVLLFVTTIFWVILPFVEKSLLDKKKEMIRELTHTACSILNTFETGIRQGRLQPHKARQAALEQIRRLRYGPEMKDYFWILDKRSRLIMHPYRPDLEGTDAPGFVDLNHEPLMQKMVDSAAESGAGYVDYLWQWKDDSRRVVPKISYVKRFGPWGWTVGTGIYIEDIHHEIAVMTRKLMVICLSILGAIVLLSAYMIWQGIGFERDRQQTLKALRNSEERYRRVFENTGTATVIAHADMTIEMCNAEFEKLSGCAKAELEGRRKWTSFFEDNGPESMKAFFSDRRPGDSGGVDEEFRFFDQSGTEKHVLCKISPIFTSGRHVISIIDISGRQKIENALLASEEKFRSITASAKDAIIIMDSSGKISYWNPAAEVIFGYSAEELKGKDLHAMIGLADSRGSFLKAFPEFQKTGQAHVIGKTLELTAVKKNGTVFPVDLSVSAVCLQGEWHAIGIIRDVSQRKELEEKLRQSHKMEAIGTLAGGIAHDFNNILGGIMGYTELAVMDASERSCLYQNLQQVLKGAYRAKDLVRQILTFSRQGDHERKPIYIEPIVADVVKLLRSSLPTTIEIRTTIAPETGAVEADSTQIYQVLMNLCTNAGHAMRDNGGILEIVLKEVLLDAVFTASFRDIPPGRYLQIIVSDTGCGMTSDIVERIFDPYFTTREKGEGTGLGLAVVHGIVRSYGGIVTVKSVPGKGSIFDLFLPVIEKKVDADVLHFESLPRGNERILFVDDEVVLVEIGGQMLEHLGYSVDTQSSSVDALSRFRQDPDQFDLVITDMTMPDLTGDKLAAEIIRLRPGLPVIICTGYSEHLSEKKAKEMGIAAFIMKPLIMRDLALTVRRLLDRC